MALAPLLPVKPVAPPAVEPPIEFPSAVPFTQALLAVPVGVWFEVRRSADGKPSIEYVDHG